MDVIGNQKLWTFLPSESEITTATCTAIRKAGAVRVKSYMELATRIAELQFRNRDYVLMFRGQNGDFKNLAKRTSLKPTLLRGAGGKLPTEKQMKARFEGLLEAEKSLVQAYTDAGLLGASRLKRQRILRWALLQHYEICPTPLLDVTHSIRIAASFASVNASSQAFVFVLGMPFLSGAITASAEAGLQIVRLSSVCPPSAARPHIQEGYLLGEYPDFPQSSKRQIIRISSSILVED